MEPGSDVLGLGAPHLDGVGLLQVITKRMAERFDACAVAGSSTRAAKNRRSRVEDQGST